MNSRWINTDMKIRHPSLARWIIAVLFGCLPCIAIAETAETAETAYVTDHPSVGVYKGKSQAGTPLEVLPSGTALEVLFREGELVRVRTADGVVGWLKGDDLMREKPARLQLLDLEAANRKIQAELEEAEDKLRALIAERAADAAEDREAIEDHEASGWIESLLPSLTYAQWILLGLGFLLAFFLGGSIAHRVISRRYHLVVR